MRKTSSVLAASIIVLALSACIDDGVSVDFMNRNGEFITGGVTDSSFPAVGALVTPYFNESFCTGTLITPTRVLTAAHCVEATWPEDLKMAFGPDENHWTHVIDVTRVVSHYDYKVMTGVRPSDIAYLD
ncbi:trypsin-like serine protease, partial [Myxococcota bacterium]|nr:trypsin-like serine protease [Myxococcota bacterium]